MSKEKREEMHEANSREKIVLLTAIVIHYYISGMTFFLNLKKLNDLLEYINIKLKEKGKSEEYILPLPLRITCIEKMLENNSEVLCILDSKLHKYTTIYFAHCSEQDKQLLQQTYPLDDEIKEIIVDFIKKE